MATLDAIARWLTASRSSFLESIDCWDLGPSSEEEIRPGLVTVLQKDLCGVLSLTLDSGTFSRHIGSARLVWSDAWAPLSLLFSREAKAAWTARAVFLSTGRRLSERDCAFLAGSQPPRSRAERAALLGRSRAGMDLVDLVRYSCLLTDSRWEDAWDAHRDRLEEEHGEARP